MRMRRTICFLANLAYRELTRLVQRARRDSRFAKSAFPGGYFFALTGAREAHLRCECVARFASLQILLCGNWPGSRNELAGIPASLSPPSLAGIFLT